MAPLWSDWMRRLCLALTFACTASAKQHRPFIVRALQSHGQAQPLDAVVLPSLMLLLYCGHSCASNSNFRAHFTFAGHAPIFPWEVATANRATVFILLFVPTVLAFFRRGGLGQAVDPTLDYQPVD